MPELQLLEKGTTPDNDTLLWLAGQRGYIKARIDIVIEVPVGRSPRGKVEYQDRRLKETGLTIEASSADKVWQVLKKIINAVGDYAHGNSRPGKRYNG